MNWGFLRLVIKKITKKSGSISYNMTPRFHNRKFKEVSSNKGDSKTFANKVLKKYCLIRRKGYELMLCYITQQ